MPSLDSRLGGGEPAPDSAGNDGDGGGSSGPSETRRLGRLRPRLGRLFAPRLFVLALALSVGGVLVGGAVPIVGIVGRLVGIAAAGAVLALVSAGRRYAEVGLAGALAAGLGFVVAATNLLVLPGIADYGLRVAGVGTTAGLVAALLGHYLGRDLRAGLTRDL
jgi:hypothetical protein